MKRNDPLDDLLLPVSEDNPGGADLLHGPEFDAVAEARREDDPTLPRGVWTAELKRADWPQAARLCREVLALRSKDLQVAAWLGEAWIVLDGVAGGARATDLVARLCERFWDTLHPLPREGDIEFRTAPLLWLDEHWSRALLVRVPLLRGGDTEAREVTLANWRESLALENSERKAGDKKSGTRPATSGSPTRVQILAQARAAPWAELEAALAGLDEWLARLARLQGVLEACLEGAAPPLHRLRAVIDEARRAVQGWMSERPERPALDLPAADDEPLAQPPSATAMPAPAATPGPTPIASRAEAYARLRQVADYLAQLEPHSPVPALLRRAVDWGAMPFDRLLKELTHNNNEMQKVLLRDAIE